MSAPPSKLDRAHVPLLKVDDLGIEGDHRGFHRADAFNHAISAIRVS